MRGTYKCGLYDFDILSTLGICYLSIVMITTEKLRYYSVKITISSNFITSKFFLIGKWFHSYPDVCNTACCLIFKIQIITLLIIENS